MLIRHDDLVIRLSISKQHDIGGYGVERNERAKHEQREETSHGAAVLGSRSEGSRKEGRSFLSDCVLLGIKRGQDWVRTVSGTKYSHFRSESSLNGS